MTSPVSVIIFVMKDDPFDAWGRAKVLHAELARHNIESSFINRLTSNIDELHLVAKHRIVYSPTILVLRDGKVISRVTGVPDVDDIQRIDRVMNTISQTKSGLV